MAGDEHGDTRVSLVVAGYTVAIVLTVLSTGLRLFVKISGLLNDYLHLDDYLIVLASIIEVGNCATILGFALRHGFGRHASTLNIGELEMFLKAEYISSHLYNVGLAMLKLGILALYYRIFPIPWFSKTVIACAVFIVLWITTIEIFMGLLCRPIDAFWNLAMKGQCFNSTALTYYVNTSNMITDLVIFALPIPVIVRLRMTRNKKIALCAIFSIGFTTCGISAARLAYVFAQSSSDITWDGVPLGVLSAFESLGGVLCANLPCIYRCLKQAARKVTSRTGGSSSGPTSDPESGRRSNTHTSTIFSRRHRPSNAADEQCLRSNEISFYFTYGQGIIGDVEAKIGMETDANVVELGPMAPNGITVERNFHQSVEKEGRYK